MADKPSRRLVVDASILRAAGGIAATGDVSLPCRLFLEAIRRICHRVRLTKSIRIEWDKHQSQASIQWRTSMTRIGKIDDVACDPDDSMRVIIGQKAPNPGVGGLLLKDAHLVEAALISDGIIVSLDDQAGDHFAGVSTFLTTVDRIAWINPTDNPDYWLQWLEGGAKISRAMTLRHRKR